MKLLKWLVAAIGLAASIASAQTSDYQTRVNTRVAGDTF